MQVSTITTTTVFYTVATPEGERHFFTLWEMIAFISEINLEAQKN
jgi:hypothetical protein